MTSAPLSTQPDTAVSLRRWWWPYTHRTVVRLCLVLLVLKLSFGVIAGIGTSARGSREAWTWSLAQWSLTYDFGWAELTEGEGSLFWMVAVNGYWGTDARNIAKFPLYPGVTRVLWDLSGQRVGSAMILSLLHSLMVWAGVAELFRFWENYRPGYGRRAVLWALLSPLFVLHLWVASYMEPGFIALLWLSLTLEYQGRWAASSAALLCLTMLQPSGVIIACFLGLRRVYHWLRGQGPFSAVVWALLPGLIWAAWMLLTSVWLNRFLAPYAYQEDWERSVYLWPWDRWLGYLRSTFDKKILVLGDVIKNVSIAWIMLGYVVGGSLWTRLSHERRARLGGAYALPLFTIVIVLVPFSTMIAGVDRYALTSLIAVWPLLFSDATQDWSDFRDLEQVIWMISAVVCALIMIAFVTGNRTQWMLVF